MNQRIRDMMDLEIFLFGVPPRSIQDIPIASVQPDLDDCEIIDTLDDQNQQPIQDPPVDTD